MMFIGDVHIYVSDFTLAMRFWADGLGLKVAERHTSPNSAFARLDFPDGGPSLRILSPVEPWPADGRPEPGVLPEIRFDVTTSDFDATLVRLLEHGGRQVDEVETYEGLRAVGIADPDGNSFELLEIDENDAALLEGDEEADEEDEDDEDMDDEDSDEGDEEENA